MPSETAVLVETQECATQTVSAESISNQILAEDIRKRFAEKGDISELLSIEWPPCAFQSTSIVKSGINKTTEGSARVIITRPGEILNPKVLAPGKVATIRCEEAIEIDGQLNGNGKEFIIVGYIESTEPKSILELTDKVTEEVRKSHTKKMMMVFPADIEPNTARKVVEISTEGTDIRAIVYASRSRGRLITAVLRDHVREPAIETLR